MHQRDVLIAAIESRGTPAAFDAELTRLFGTAFTTVSMDPVGAERPRRVWESTSTARTGQLSSQSEQRVVDVTLRDLLSKVHALPPHQKVGWCDFLDALTLHSTWRGFVAQVEAAAGRHDKNSGYFWASVLAAASGAGHAGGAPLTARVRATDIEAFPSTVSTDFEHSRHPRARAGIRVQLVKEMSTVGAVTIGAAAIAAEWNASTLSLQDRITVLTVVGSALSAD